MKKLYVQIHQHRFSLESRGTEEDALVQAAAKDLTEKIGRLRRDHGIPDSARATALAALLIALEKKSDRKDSGEMVVKEAGCDRIKSLLGRIEETLVRTDHSPAKVSA